jgi:hypothetical protein
LAVNLNSSLPANHGVATVFNPKAGLKIPGGENRPVDLPVKNVEPATNTPQVKADREAIKFLDEDRQNKEKHNLDSPDRATKEALTAYRDVASTDKREEIQSLVGVDLFV